MNCFIFRNFYNCGPIDRWYNNCYPYPMYHHCCGGFGEYFKWMGISHAIRSMSEGISQIFHPNQTPKCYNPGYQMFPYVNYMC